MSEKIKEWKNTIILNNNKLVLPKDDREELNVLSSYVTVENNYLRLDFPKYAIEGNILKMYKKYSTVLALVEDEFGGYMVIRFGNEGTVLYAFYYGRDKAERKARDCYRYCLEYNMWDTYDNEIIV